MLETSARLLRLLSLLEGRRFWTGPELASQLGITRRTLRRDVDRLRSLGYPVDSSGGVAGGYQLGVGAVLPPLLLDDDEAVAISFALRTVATGSVGGIEPAALRALAKLERLLPRRLRQRMRAMQRSVATLPPPWPRADADTLTMLAEASRARYAARFFYTSGAGERTERRVEPHGLVHTGVRWYLVAWDRVREDWRTFRVDRIEGVPEALGTFTPRSVPGGDLADFVSRAVASSGRHHRVTVRVEAPVERVAPILTKGCRLIPDGPDRCLLEVGTASLDGVALYLASLLEEFEVVEPRELNDALRRLSDRLARAARPPKRESAGPESGAGG